MKIDVKKLENLVTTLNKNVGRFGCVSHTVCIGMIDGKPIYITILTEPEAVSINDFCEVDPLDECIIEN